MVIGLFRTFATAVIPTRFPEILPEIPMFSNARVSPCSSLRRRAPQHGAEADVDRPQIGCLRLARARAVAAAEIGRAQPRPALDHMDFGPPGGRGRRLMVETARVRSALLHRVMIAEIPVGRPFPNIAGHIEEAIAVWRETADGSGAAKTILRLVLIREETLPGIRHPLSAGALLVPPRIGRTFETAARRKLPFGLA